MANLPENPATWETGIYQIEATDPVNGGAPNVATGAGMSNIPHKQLADRTAYLKKVIDDTGLGAAAVPLVTLNSAAARITGSYRFASGDANTPAAGVAGTLEVIAASASAVNQTARDSASTRIWTRFWNGTVWSAWAELWRTTGVSESIGANGWQRLPSGLIMQWGATSQSTSAGVATISFPLTFPTAVLQSFAHDPNDTLDINDAFVVAAVAASTSQLSIRWRRVLGASGGVFAINWFAIGN
jgi:hypothetical protein